MKIRTILLILQIYLAISLSAQEPFVCDGSFYLTLRKTSPGQSKLFKIERSEDLSEIIFAELGPDSAGVYLNAIGYRKTDNFIYGLNLTNYDLYKVDNKGKGIYLDDLEGLDTLSIYIAGDVTLDGRYLVLMERKRINNMWQDIALVFIDLTDPEYPMNRRLIMDDNGELPLILSADVAINPFSGLLYAYNVSEKKLMTIDLETGIASSENFLTDINQPEVLGALFFDEFSRLLGYGRQLDSIFQNTLFEIDVNTGLGQVLKIGPEARGNDGCNCIQPIGLQKTVWPVQTVPCTEVTYTLYIANATGNPIENISLSDTLDADLRFLSLDYNPYSGDFSFDSLNNTLHFSNLILTSGIDSIIFTALVAPTASVGQIDNQAEIENPSSDNASIVYSDYPRTFEKGDPTPLEILAPFEMNEVYHYDTTICLGQGLTLVSQFPNANYVWEDFEGQTTDRITVETGGTYFVTTEVGCQIITEVFQVTEEWINFSLGEDQYIDLGEFIEVSPIVQTTSPESIYQWMGLNPAICIDCPTQNFIPLEDETVSLSITNEAGCMNADSVAIFVNLDRSVFVPNAISPNGDGINDFVFANTKISRQILYFRIYNRWGAEIFENKNGFTNDPTFGWNGTFKGQDVSNGVFVYDILLVYPDGVQQQISGDITVIK